MNGSGEPSITGPAGAGTGGDTALVVRIAAREEAAFRLAIEKHAPLLHRIAYRMIGEAHEAEDIVQEALLRLWDHAPRLAARHAGLGSGADEMRLAAWLKRVAVNLVLDRLRATRRHADAQVPEQTDESPLADARIAAEQEGQAARALITALPDRQRAAIVLTYYEELPNAEAAAVLDMNLKAFESLLHRARLALRKAFEEQHMRPDLEGGAA